MTHSEQIAMLDVSTAAAPTPFTTLNSRHRTENQILCLSGIRTLRANPKLAKEDRKSPRRSMALRLMILCANRQELDGMIVV